jgi:hypothetical protein
MKIMAMFDVLHAKVVRNVVFQKFTDFTRVILSVSFFAPGMHKLMGIPFTNLPLDNPIGAFFNALYQTGFYYRFLGAAQVLAAIFVLFRRTATLGALLFFGITSNVFLITISIPFGTGTPIVTGLMFLASLYLVCWDYDKLKPLLAARASDVFNQQAALEKPVHRASALSRIGYWVFAIAGSLLMCEMRGLTPVNLDIRLGAFLISAFGGLVMASGFAIDIVSILKHRTQFLNR